MKDVRPMEGYGLGIEADGYAVDGWDGIEGFGNFAEGWND